MPIYEVQFSPPGAMVIRGPQIPIDISLPQNLIQQLSQQGQQIPAPISGPALVDTGASISAIDLSIIQRLNLHSIGVATIGTAGRPSRRNLYPARFTLPFFVADLGRVIGADLIPFQITAIIGRDILSRIILIYQGPANRFTLAV